MTMDDTDAGPAHCCVHEWLEIFYVNYSTRSNGRQTAVVRHNGAVVAWATWMDCRQHFHVVTLYGGAQFYEYATFPDFLRIVRETIIDDVTPSPTLLWQEGPL